jgi:hypothetical protein
VLTGLCRLPGIAACTADNLPIGSAGDIILKAIMPKMKIGDLNASGTGGTFTVDWVRP